MIRKVSKYKQQYDRNLTIDQIADDGSSKKIQPSKTQILREYSQWL